MKTHLIIIKGVILVILGLTKVDLTCAKDEEFAVDQEINNMKFVAPFYDEIRSMSEGRKKWNVDFSKELHELLFQSNDDLLIKKYSTAKMSPWAAKFAKFFRKKKAELEELTNEENSPKPTEQFLKDIVRLWKEILKAGKAQAKAAGGGRIKSQPATEEEAEKFIKDFNNVLSTTHSAIAASPVGSHFDWFNVKIDDKPMVQFSAKYMAFYYQHGPRGLMKLMALGTSMIEKLI